jgi:hypothetical protein
MSLSVRGIFAAAAATAAAVAVKEKVSFFCGCT